MLDPLRHQCLIYAGAASSHLSEVATTLIQRLNANQRCLYLNSPSMVAGMRSQLSSQGLSTQSQLDRGALLLSSDQRHLVNRKFDVDRMLCLLDDAMNRALADGFAGLWAAGDMTWEFGSEENLNKLLEYERRLEAFMQDNDVIGGVCLYHRDTLPAHAIETAFLTHPAMYVSATWSQLNARYSPQLAGNA